MFSLSLAAVPLPYCMEKALRKIYQTQPRIFFSKPYYNEEDGCVLRPYCLGYNTTQEQFFCKNCQEFLK